MPFLGALITGARSRRFGGTCRANCSSWTIGKLWAFGVCRQVRSSEITRMRVERSFEKLRLDRSSLAGNSPQQAWRCWFQDEARLASRARSPVLGRAWNSLDTPAIWSYIFDAARPITGFRAALIRHMPDVLQARPSRRDRGKPSTSGAQFFSFWMALGPAFGPSLIPDNMSLPNSRR